MMFTRTGPNWGRAAASACLSVLAVLAGSGRSRAQTLDYDAASKLFGEPVTMSVTGSPQRVSDAPADIEIVTADDIRRSGAYDIPGVLEHLEGVDVLQFTDDDAEIGIHGYDEAYSPRILVLIDGRQVYADFYGYTPWSTLPVELSAIRQIEVVKGPNSALFGFNAVGGVINIITDNPLDSDVNTASISGGTQGLAQMSAVGTFKLADGLATRIQIGGRRDDSFSTPVPASVLGLRGPDSRASIDVKTSMRASDGLQFDIDASHTAVEQNDFPVVDRVVNVRYDVNSILGRATLDSALGLAQAQIYSNWDSYAFPGELTNGAQGKLVNQVTVAQLQDVWKPGTDHTLRGSLEYRHDTVTTTTITGGHVFDDVVSAGVMWEWKIVPTLTATDSVRVDYLMLGRDGFLPSGTPFTNASWSRSFTEPSFNSSLIWRGDDLDTFRLTASRGVELPNLENLGGFVTLGAPYNFTGVPTIDPTTVTNVQAGWERAIPALGAKLHFSLYRQETTDVISDVSQLLVSPSGLFAAPANIGNSSGTGIDLKISGTFLGAWRWSVSYSPEIVTDHFIKAQIFATGVNFQDTTPVHTVNGSLGWSDENWEVDGYLRYESSFYGITSRFLDSALARINGFVTVDGRVGYKLSDRVTLSVSGQNLAQAHQRQTAGPDVERRVFGSIAVGF